MTLNMRDALEAENMQKKPREMKITKLRGEIGKRREKKINTVPLYIEIHNKLALAFSNFIFVLIGIPIAIKTHRREKSINFGLTMVLFLVYWGIMLGGVACSIRNFVPPWLGIWAANILLFIAGIFLFIRTAGK